METGDWYGSQLACFVGLKGEKFGEKGKFLVIGRAVNGWWYSDKPEDWKALEKRNGRIEEMFKDRHLMTWVTEQWGSKDGYNTKRSAFWRVTRELVRRLGIADVENDEWPSHIAWSNLYKVSPDGGGNPTEMLKEAQFPGCAQILAAEIRELKPQTVVFLTGWKWAEKFLSALEAKQSVSGTGGVLEAWGHLPSGSEFVVLPHPQGKSEGKIVNAAVNGFERLRKK